MQSMTIAQLRAESDAGGVEGVTLKGLSGEFVVQIASFSGVTAVLAKTYSRKPFRFSNPISALNVLRGVGITIGRFDIGDWNPAEKEETASGRAEATRKTHQASVYIERLAAEIQEAIDDPRPSVPHNDVMARVDVRIARYKAAGTARK